MSKMIKLNIFVWIVCAVIVALNLYPLTSGTNITCYGLDANQQVISRSAGFPVTFLKTHAGDNCVEAGQPIQLTSSNGNNYYFSFANFGMDLVLAGTAVFATMLLVSKIRNRQ